MTVPTKDLSLEERAALGSGADFWTTKAVGSVPSLMLTDGPHGVRKQTGASDHLGLAGSEPATCFPPAVGLGQCWDVGLVARVGEALGREARSLGVDVLLGPGVNIKRDPRCGRNFEYFSEDPVVSGALGAAWVTGVQSVGVGTSLKHFALNNAETDRMRSSSDIDPRPMHEIYLRAFSHIVRTARPWTVMCSYNRINGVYAAENHWLLTELLREQWGFDGVVVSDWGAVRDRVAAVRAGLDLEMPAAGTGSDDEVVAAVRAGELSEDAVDRAASAMALLADRTQQARDTEVAVDIDEHHRLAREVAARSIVLLKNDDDLLPLRAGAAVAVIGDFARSPRYQGGGSSHVNPTHLDIPVDEIRAQAGSGAVTMSQGFTTDGSGDPAALRDDAVRTAADAEVAVVFVGLGDDQESEGFDREHIEIPSDQLALVAAVVQVQPNTVVVLSHGGVLRVRPIVDAVPAILDGALLGQAGGGAIADVLFGAVNPSGRLTETVPIRLQDCPSYLNFPGENSHVRYGEGIGVGYRGYDARDVEVTFPFGHGLSYSTFEYSELSCHPDDAGVTVRVTVTNTGNRAGRDIVQVYTAKSDSRVARPPRELKGFTATSVLEPAASEQISIQIARTDLAYWDTRIDGWAVEDGTYGVEVGASSRDIRVRGEVHVRGDEESAPITWQSTLAEALADPVAGPAMVQLLPGDASGTGDALGMDIVKVMGSMPLDRLARFGMGSDALTELLDGGA